MLFSLEAILNIDDGMLIIQKRTIGTDKAFVVKLSCKFGELRAEDKSLTDALTKVLHAYKVLSENEVTVEQTPF